MINEINIEEAKTNIEDGAIVLDVRTKGEYNQGHIVGSINIDIYKSSFEEDLSKLDKEKRYVVCCASGARSLSAVNKMLELGFVESNSMAGGMSEWKKEGMEVDE